MLPHSYTVDSLSQCQDLASIILSSSTSQQISSACASIESFLHSHSPDQCRHFFSVTFPPLICKLFGFNDATSSPAKPQLQSFNGWIDTVLLSGDSDLAARVFSLLSPDGTLMSTISALDRLSLVKYVFPIERLPEWTQFMLSSDQDCRLLSVICPLFKGKVGEDSIKGSLHQIQLNVFEYYMFWFAYYPVCRGNNENLASVSVKRSNKFSLENWTYSIRGCSSANKPESERKLECNLYIRLLRAYLRSFVPVLDFHSHQPYRSSLLHYASGHDGSIMLRAEFLVNTFVHYWLVNNDFSPFPVNMCKTFGVSFPSRLVQGETLPTSGLGEVVKLFVKYLNLSWVAGADGVENNVECSSSPRWKMSCSASFDVVNSRDVVSVSPSACLVGSWNSWIQRPLYRLLLRAFLFCPMGTSIKSISEVFSIWVSYMEPWMISLNDFTALDEVLSGSAHSMRTEESGSQASGFSYLWQGYVLCNYLYYSCLVMHFIVFAHKFLHDDPEAIVQMVLKVMNILTSPKELTGLIKDVDTVFHSKQSGSGKLMLNSLYRFVPSIREQLLDWEDGLYESDANGSFLHRNWNKDLQLFNEGEDGGQQLLQLFILRAEAEFQATSGDNLAQNLQYIDSLRAQVSCFFGDHIVKPISFSPETVECPKSRDEIFKPRRIGNQAMSAVKYKGDWMRRPISEDEVAWLVKLLVLFSVWVNESLGLNKAEEGNGSSKLSYVVVSEDVENMNGPAEAMKVVVRAVTCWLLMLGATVVRLMRRCGMRVNLRVLASKKLVMVFLILALFSMLKRAFGCFISCI